MAMNSYRSVTLFICLLVLLACTFLALGNAIARVSNPSPQAVTTFMPPPVVRGTPGDLWADIILGKPDFSDIGPYTTVANRFFFNHGAIVDTRNTTDNKLYVYDSGNNRILGFHVSDCLANPSTCLPSVIIGQASP